MKPKTNEQATNYISILHQNIRGVKNKVERLNHLLNDTDPSIVVLTEHGLTKEKLHNTRVEGYSLITHYSRKDHKLGGVAIYVKEALATKAKHLDVINFCEEFICEVAVARVETKEKLLYILGIYRTPGVNVKLTVGIVANILDHLQAHNKHFVVIGDINIDRLKDDSDNIVLEEELSTHNIRRLPLPATRITTDTATSIDCICTSIPESEINALIIQSGLSDHTAQVLQIEYKKRISSTCQRLLKRQMGLKNLNNLKEYLKCSDWRPILISPDPESSCNSFLKITGAALDSTCPLKETKARKNSKAKLQYDSEAKLLKDNYIKALNESEATGRNQDKETMVTAKKAYDNKLRALRQTSNAHYIAQADNKTKALWSLINNERKKPTAVPHTQIKVNNNITEDPRIIAEAFNVYFAQIAEKTLSQNGLAPQHVIVSHPVEEQCSPQTMSLYPTTEKEVQDTINSFKPKTSSGVDEYSSKAVKHCAKELSIPLVSIINNSFSKGQFPTALKLSKVYPKHKNGAASEISNYRPISLVSTFSKIIEKIALQRLLAHLKMNDLITKSQHGFLEGKSTNTAIISLIEQIIKQIDDEQFTTGLFLDYSKAFDCLSHTLITKKLQSLGVRGVANNWFRSYLEGRQQVVEVQITTNNCTRTHKSTPKTLTRGVPQGSVLGPVLFILLTNDFPALIQNANTACIMYADDTTLLINNDTTNGIHNTATTALTTTINYCKKNDLVMNPSKTIQINFSKKKACIPDLPNISTQTSVKFLGVTLDKDLTWSEHVNNVCKKMSSGVYVVRRMKWIGGLESAKLAYYALVDSHMRYGLAAWGGSSAGNLNRVLIIQKKAIRTLANLQQWESCRQSFSTLGILTVTAVYILQVIMHVDKQNLQTSRDIHAYNTRHAAKYTLPRHRTALFEKNPSYIGRKLKNMLPNNLSCLTGKHLKKEVQRYLINNPVYTIDEFQNRFQAQ